MKERIVIAFLVVFGGLGITFKSNLQTTTAQDDKGRVPPDVVVLAENSKLGKVVFNHGDHSTKDYNIDGTAQIDCIKCHHVEQPASEVVKDPLYKTAYPTDRTATLTLESLKDPKTPSVTACRSCHIPNGVEPTVLTEIPKIEDEKSGKTITLTNQNAFHRSCAGCHDQVSKERPTVKAPKTMKCFDCHKKG